MSKPDAKDAAPAKEAASAPAPEAAPKGGGIGAMLPAILAIVLAPAVSFAVAEFVLLPRLQAKLGKAAAQPAAHGEASADPHAEAPAEEPAAEEPAAEESGGHGGGHGEAKGDGNYEFTNVVVNLAGTMGTRYLKTSFVVTGVKGKPTKAAFEAQKAKLTDITLSVLSALTLVELEQPGAKNLLRERLVGAYNQALGKRVVDQVYFSDFVVQ